MKTTRTPYGLDLECRRLHRYHSLKAQLAWFFVFLASLILCVSLGMLAGAASPLAGLFAGFVVLAGLKSAHYLLTRH
jgi:hypothetical protein